MTAVNQATYDRILRTLDDLARRPGPHQTAVACLGHEVRYNLLQYDAPAPAKPGEGAE